MLHLAAAQAVPRELELVLQHAAISLHCSTLCSLLCVSKGVQQTVASVPDLQLAVHLTDEWSESKACSFAAFARRFGTVLREIKITMAIHPQLKRVAAALMYAAMQPQGLNIRSLVVNTPHAQPLCLVPWFSKALTRLEIDFSHTSGDDDVYQLQDAAEVVLSALSNLRALGIYQLHPLERPNQLLSPVSGLTKLTSLTAAGLLYTQELPRLPVQLRELYLSYSPYHYYEGRADDSQLGLQLTHLTALTKLGDAVLDRLSPWQCEQGHVLGPHDTLPSGLRQATFLNIRSMQPLLHLPNLQDLTIMSANMLAGEWLQLGAVSSLTAISLFWKLSQDGPRSGARRALVPPIVAAFRVLSALPVTCLQLDCDLRYLPLDAVKALSELSSATALTALTISGCNVRTSTARAFAAALSPLKALQHLTLSGRGYDGRPARNLYDHEADWWEDRSRSPSDGRPWSPASEEETSSIIKPSERQFRRVYDSRSRSRSRSWSRSRTRSSSRGRSPSGYSNSMGSRSHGGPRTHSGRSSPTHPADEGLSYHDLVASPQDPMTLPQEDVMTLVCGAVSNLHQLRSLHMLHKPLTTAAAQRLQGLGTADQLTSLRLDACQVTDDAIGSLLGSLPGGLRHLDLGRRTRVGEKSLDVVGWGLPHLTELNVGCWLPWCNRS